LKIKKEPLLKSIAIIVLNWCGWRDTLACLESLQKLIVPFSITIIVCDNASNDDSFDQILNWAQQHYSASEIGVFSQITDSDSRFPFVLIQTGANLGFAGGNNVGIRYALSQGDEYLWLLNNDTVVDAHALSTLYECAVAHPQIALLGSTMIDFYQTEKVQCAGGCRYFPLWTIFKPVLGGQSVNAVRQYDEAISLDYVYGAAVFLKAEAVKKVGLLNERFFLFM
jgi:GT2 family glycosyltransferase